MLRIRILYQRRSYFSIQSMISIPVIFFRPMPSGLPWLLVRMNEAAPPAFESECQLLFSFLLCPSYKQLVFLSGFSSFFICLLIPQSSTLLICYHKEQ